MSEGAPNQERIEKQRLLELLREKGFDDEGAKEIFRQWYIEQELLAEEQGTLRARLLFHLDLVDLYFAGGAIDEAHEAINDILRQSREGYDVLGRPLVGGDLEIYERALQVLKDLPN